MRALLVGLLGILIGCSPAANAPEPPAPAAQSATAQSPVDALEPVIEAEVGIPLALRATTINVVEGWAYVEAQPKNPDGSDIDWATTSLASRYENGAMDTGGSVHALLRNDNGSWTLLEHVIAPTDVAWLDWAARHGAPASIVELPAAPAP